MSRETADAVIIGGGRRGADVRHRGGQPRAARGGAGAQRADRAQDPDLRRRALQFHQPAHHGGEFLSRNPHFAKSALARYTPRDFIALVERHGIPYHEKTLGQLFCDRAASEIVQMLEAECAAAGVRIETACAVTRGDAAAFEVETSRGAFQCAALVIATGGLSIPKMGATPFGYEVARQFGLRHRGVPSGAGAVHVRRRRIASASTGWREFRRR